VGVCGRPLKTRPYMERVAEADEIGGTAREGNIIERPRPRLKYIR
jgi:hypothetical protein